jgi:hypothetical protein
MESKQLFLLELLTPDSGVVLNRRLLRLLKGNCDAVLMLTDIIVTYRKSWRHRQVDPQDGSFLLEAPEYVTNRYGVSRGQQQKGLDTLEKEKFISVFRKESESFSNVYATIHFDTIFASMYPPGGRKENTTNKTFSSTEESENKLKFYEELNKKKCCPAIRSIPHGLPGRISIPGFPMSCMPFLK